MAIGDNGEILRRDFLKLFLFIPPAEIILNGCAPSTGTPDYSLNRQPALDQIKGWDYRTIANHNEAQQKLSPLVEKSTRLVYSSFPNKANAGHYTGVQFSPPNLEPPYFFLGSKLGLDSVLQSPLSEIDFITGYDAALPGVVEANKTYQPYVAYTECLNQMRAINAAQRLPGVLQIYIASTELGYRLFPCRYIPVIPENLNTSSEEQLYTNLFNFIEVIGNADTTEFTLDNNIRIINFDKIFVGVAFLRETYPVVDGLITNMRVDTHLTDMQNLHDQIIVIFSYLTDMLIQTNKTALVSHINRV